jgi:putative SOS response-associated peptidase YedK
MCGRVTQKTGELPGFVSLMGGPDPSRPPQARWNGAPSQDFWIIRKNPKTRATQRDRLIWGLIPSWCKDPGGRKPINAKSETASSLPTFRDAYAHRRCLLPIDNFFEWKAMRGQRTKQPYAIAMRTGEPFALAAIWENWRAPDSEEWVRTFCILTTNANDLVSDIHDRMPVIIPPEAYDRWLANLEPDPRDLLVPYPPELMTMWPISTRVNKPENDDPNILDAIEEPATSQLL